MYAYIPNLLTKTEFCVEQTKHVVLAAIVLKGFGGVGFILELVWNEVNTSLIIYICLWG